MSGIGNAATNYNGRPQIMNLGSEKFDVKQLLEFDLQVLEQKKNPYLTKISDLQKEKNAWESLIKSMNELKNISQSLADYRMKEKNVSFSNEYAISGVATNAATDGKYQIMISSIAESQRVASDKFEGESINVDETLMINGKELELESDMSLRDVAKKINSGEYGVEAIILNGRLTLTSQETGLGNEIEVGDSQFFRDIGLLNENGEFKNEINSASNASFTINGIEYEQDSNIVDDIDGLSLTLKQTTIGNPIEVTVGASEEKFIETVTELVETYNNLINNIEKLSGEGQILQGKRIPQNAKFELSNIFSTLSSSGFLSSDFGIELDRDRDGGRIRLDEDKLIEQFRNNQEDAFNFLVSKDGFADQITGIMNKLTSEKGLISYETKGIEENIKNAEKTIDRLDVTFEQRQKSLIFKYAQLEVMMNQMELQNKMLTAQLEAFNKNN